MAVQRVLLLLALLQGYQCPAIDNDPIYAWPLGYKLPIREVINDTANGTIGHIAFEQGPSVFSYDACSFNGSNSSFVDFIVLDHTAFYNDHSVQFYVRIDSPDGVILDYVSDDVSSASSAANLITRMTIEVFQRELKITYTGQNVILANGGSQMLGITLSLGQWYHVIIERDYSRDAIKPYFDQIKLVDVQVLVGSTPFYLPGRFYVGKSADNDGRYLDGAVACLQIIPSKGNPAGMAHYNDFCKASNWPATTTTPAPTSTTTTTPAPTSTTTTTPAPTTTTTPAPTTTTTPAPTTTTTPAPTTTTTPAPTTTTTPAPTTTTTTTTDYTTTSTTSSASSTTSTTTSAPTSTTTTPAPMATTTLAPPPSMDLTVLIVGCSQFHVSAQNATFASTADIVATVVVDDVRSCLLVCSKQASCREFVLTATNGLSTKRMCKMGRTQSPILFETGSTLYTV